MAQLGYVLYAAVAQMVERIHGKDEVSGSIPDCGSRDKKSLPKEGIFCWLVLAIRK